MLDDTIVVGNRSPGSDTAPGSRAARPLAVRMLRAVWLWPAALMAGLGLLGITRPLMWHDELVTINVARRSVRQILDLVSTVDAVHGAYYLFMHGWIRIFGDSEFVVRVPSALAMAAAAGSVALLGQRLFGRVAGLLGGVVFALVPAVTRFAQETRSYAFVVLFVSLASLLLLVAIDRSTIVRWAAYALCVTAVASLNAVALAVIVGHLAVVLIRAERRWRRLLQFAAAVIVGVAPVLPLLLAGSQQAARQVVWVPHDTLWRVWPQTFSSAGVAWLVTLLAVVAWIGPRREAAVGTALAVVPMLVVWFASLGDLSYFFSKYILFVVPAWAMLAGAGLAALSRWRLVVWWAAPVTALTIVAAAAIPGQVAMRGELSHSWYTYPGPRPLPPLDYAAAARLVSADHRAGDGIVYLRAQHWWYMHDTGVPYYLPDNVRPRDVFLLQAARDARTLNSLECPASIACIGPEPRIWLIVPFRTADPLGHLSVDQIRALSAHYAQTRVMHPSGMTVALLERVR